LCYFASENKFLSHSGNYQLKCIDWADNKNSTVLDYQLEYPDESNEFAGLYGYNLTFSNCNFIAGSNRFFLI
jgi:hypothetical protein